MIEKLFIPAVLLLTALHIGVIIYSFVAWGVLAGLAVLTLIIGTELLLLSKEIKNAAYMDENGRLYVKK